MSEELLTIEELAEVLKTTRQKVSELVEKGLPFLKVGDRKRFEKEAVFEWLRNLGGDKYEE